MDAGQRGQQLRESVTDAMYGAVVAASPLGIAVVRRVRDGRNEIVTGNPALAALYDRPLAELPGRFVEDLLVDRTVHLGVTGDWPEHLIRVADGAERWARWHVTPLENVDPENMLFIVHVDVIHERVKARHRAHRQTRLLDLIPDPVIIRALDGTILYWNTGAAETYGYSSETALGRRTHDLLATRFDGVTLGELEDRLATEGSWRGYLEHRHADGRTLRINSKQVYDENDDGEPVILEVNVDVTERVAAEQALVASEAKFRSQFLNSKVGQIIRGLDGTIEDVNQAMADMLGYRTDQLLGTSVHRLFTEAAAALRRDTVAALMNGEVDAVNGESVLIRADGSQLDVEINVSLARTDADGAVRVVGIYRDITARKIAENALTYRASHDPLTGLANRALVIDRIDRALVEAVAEPRTVGLLYLDLDGFKAVNDEFGHHTGDVLLAEVAQRLLQCVRGGDTVARLGGDEFVVLCPDLDTPSRLHAVAHRVRTTLGAPYDLAGRGIDTVTASVGVSFPRSSAGALQALRDADQAMYEVKRAGKNRIGLHVAAETDDADVASLSA